MILYFKDRGKGLPIFVGIGKDYVVSMACSITNNIFVPLSEYDRFVKPDAFKLVKAMVDKFKLLEGELLRNAIIDEMSLQADFVREVSVLEYKKFVR